MNILVVTILIILIFLILLADQKWAALAVIAGVIYLTQVDITIGGFNFTPIRFIEIAAALRVLMRREFSLSEFTTVDKYFLIFNVTYLLFFFVDALLHPIIKENLWYQIGYFVDGSLSYFIFRGLLKDPIIFRNFLKSVAYLIVPFTALITIEALSGKNLFTVMGGVPSSPILRDGYYRCQGSFRISITAGSFGATLIPLFLYLTTKERLRGVIGTMSCLIIVIASHSSGPLMGLAGGLIAWFLWPWRKRMRVLRWLMAGAVILLNEIMKAPVWFIIARISDVIGGDGWHRANLIDKFIRHFNQWWIMGMPLEKTADWAATRMPWGAVDVTNQYVFIGLNGGLISLLLFILFLAKCYKSLGKSMSRIRTVRYGRRDDELLLWALGSVLFSHTLNLIAVTYWDQFFVVWCMTLAVIAGVSAYYLCELSDLEAERERAIDSPTVMDEMAGYY